MCIRDRYQRRVHGENIRKGKQLRQNHLKNQMLVKLVEPAEKAQFQEPITRTLRPIVTGASVIGLFYKDGVMIATDTLCSYGSLAKFKDMKRIEQVSENCLIASTGEYSDFQEVMKKLGDLHQNVINYDDKSKYTPRNYATYLGRLSRQL
eukprot:TRINITY_DN826_c0_g1_i2.p2 TRINITY_DN826_c0_g1~~TRINITY_DN826_c0_g1_i2.p2  ORF type:complete len:174 (+),score=55.32 TRINITY_DN826_c0_g1_i2:73-522(+)